MKQPTTLSRKLEKPTHVTFLVKCLYDHQYTGKIWGNMLHGRFTSWGFLQSAADSRNYFFQEEIYFFQHEVDFVILVILVDDISIASNSISLMKNTKESL